MMIEFASCSMLPESRKFACRALVWSLLNIAESWLNEITGVFRFSRHRLKASGDMSYGEVITAPLLVSH